MASAKDCVDSGMVGLVGLLLGVLGGIIFSVSATPIVSNAKVIPRQGKPAVMRLYKPGRDGTMVQDGTNSNNYLTKNNYLSRFDNKYDRRIEETEIERVAFGTD